MFVNYIPIKTNKKLNKELIYNYRRNLIINNLDKTTSNKPKIETEKVFFQGPPSKYELIIPFLSILTVVGIIPFLATLMRQFWVKYTITNRRICVDSGFMGKEHVEIVYRDVKKINYITRFGGKFADVVVKLNDGTQLELRSLPQWNINIDFIKNNCDENISIN
ncbi:hypothetical protein [Guillardia theta]|uniref:YdbS-like PH domain-containing protein n=1 Tax=Guillardia theta TaxID=55529 RepID=Q9AW65_GUITH|nr:hypothetical protein GTHECHR2145 [Guillardia theta]CAC27005.1 hypothetical protein [Guillardia theta]|mmetsp:Transcript_36711/g.114616  ORF Transcript_36711/g.114616 Transcript_36711/m.114616 type:complete len:164 (+) Transcript_36711:77-568(+)